MSFRLEWNGAIAHTECISILVAIDLFCNSAMAIALGQKWTFLNHRLANTLFN
ncbi:MAG: hypothetical protein F6K30_11300 [Cyanothece sp. SIO2G6]|nr:hypothetical protein [Cyanothece sp. SIO2G6]